MLKLGNCKKILIQVLRPRYSASAADAAVVISVSVAFYVVAVAAVVIEYAAVAVYV